MKRHIILLISLVAFFGLIFPLADYAEDSWLLEIGSPLYQEIEELSINNSALPFLEDTPVSAGTVQRNLKSLKNIVSPYKTAQRIVLNLEIPYYPVSPILETGFYTGYNSDKDRIHYIQTNDRKFLDYRLLYPVQSIPSALKAGFLINAAGWSVFFQPELRKAMPFILNEDNYTNIPSQFIDLDENFPYRGYINYRNGPSEFTMARDKLQLGPGRWSSLSVNKNVPYFDYVKGKLDFTWFAFSSYLIRLNPILSSSESLELESMQAGENPEVNARVETPFSEKSKHLAVHKLFLSPFPWISFSVAELNMIGGRTPQLTDFNPVIIFHNNFEEGCNNQSLSATLRLVPLPGILLYGEYYLYDAVVADEKNPSYKPGASAYQSGFTLLSDNYLNIGPGRFRLDGEFSLVDPWCYARWYDLKKYTSRFVYVETGAHTRNWADYPLGYYLGPDVVDINLQLSYGVPGLWETYFYWKRSGLGSINLYGWGDGNLFSHTTEGNLPLTGSPTSRENMPAQWNDLFKLNFSLVALNNIKVSLWFSYEIIKNRFNIKGNNAYIYDTGCAVTWKIF